MANIVYTTPPASAAQSHSQTLGSVTDKASRWTARDDLMLADALIVQKNLGKNRDAIFTADAWSAVTAQMKGSELISGGGQKTTAQCKARWQRLKIEYRVVKHLRSQPGFSWDSQTQMLVASATIWDNYIAEHRDAQPWRKKSFPAYDKVAFIIEDENGRDVGDEQFRRRWNAQVDMSTTALESVGHTEPPGTGVFSISTPPGSVTLSVPASAPGPAIPMSLSFNGGGAVQQCQVPPSQANGKRRTSGDGQSAPTKRPKSAASSPAPQSQFHGYSNEQPLQTLPTASHASTPATRMATAIQVVEEMEGLSDEDFVKAVQLFQRRSEVSDAYLAIQSKRARSLYLRAEIDDYMRSQQQPGPG